MRSRFVLGISLVSLLGLGACQPLATLLGPDEPEAYQPPPLQTRVAEEEPRFTQWQYELTQASLPFFQSRSLEEAGALPETVGVPMTYRHAFVSEILLDLLRAVDLTPKIATNLSDKKIPLYDTTGNFARDLPRLAELGGFFYRVEGETLHLNAGRAFEVMLPPIGYRAKEDQACRRSETLEPEKPFAEGLKQAGAIEQEWDLQKRLTTYRLHPRDEAKMQDHLDTLKKNEHVVSYHAQVWRIPAEKAALVDWLAFKTRAGQGIEQQPQSDFSLPPVYEAVMPLTDMQEALENTDISAELLHDGVILARSGGEEIQFKVVSVPKACLGDEGATTFEIAVEAKALPETIEARLTVTLPNALLGEDREYELAQQPNDLLILTDLAPRGSQHRYVILLQPTVVAFEKEPF